MVFRNIITLLFLKNWVKQSKHLDTAFAFSLFVDIAEQVIDDFWGLTIADQAVELGMIQKYSVLTHLY